MKKIKVSLGRTLNAGNYESFRFDVGLELDCENEVEGYEEALKFCAVRLKGITERFKDLNSDTILKA